MIAASSNTLDSFGAIVVVASYASGKDRRSGRLALLIRRGAPMPGKQFVETALWDVGDPRENIGEPTLRIDVVALYCAGSRHSSGNSPACARAVKSCGRDMGTTRRLDRRDAGGAASLPGLEAAAPLGQGA